MEQDELTAATDATPDFDRVSVIINKYAGTVRRQGVDTITDAFRKALGDKLVSIEHGTGRDMERMVKKAVDGGARVILPIGGDGTCTAIAAMARESGTFTTSALPGGTKNILAKRLWGSNADILSVAEMIGSGNVRLRHMDAGDANGRLFFVGASFGMIPHLARARERLRGRAEPSGIWAALRHVLRLGRRGLFSPRVKIRTSGRDLTRCAALMVSVKSIDEMLFRPGEKPDPASFDCAAASPPGWLQLIGLAFKAVFTDVWRNDQNVEIFNVPELSVEGRNPVALALDGEAIALPGPVNLTMLQNAVPLFGAREVDNGP